MNHEELMREHGPRFSMNIVVNGYSDESIEACRKRSDELRKYLDDMGDNLDETDLPRVIELSRELESTVGFLCNMSALKWRTENGDADYFSDELRNNVQQAIADVNKGKADF